MSRETRDRLKAAVEELLLTKGEAGITLRDITEAAGANVAAVAYHFKSKDKLIALVFGEALQEVTRLQTLRVQALPKNHSLRELVEVWLHPILSPSGPGEREARLWRIIQRGAVEKAPGLLANVKIAVNPVEQTLLPLLASHLKHLSQDELLFRHNAVIGGLSGLVSSPVGMALAKETPDSKTKQFMVAWILGSLEGPSVH